jgi:uncharacterized iron-regulated membrane protein
MPTLEVVKKSKASLLRRMIERPQQVFLRKAFFQVHLWAGILLALYVIAIGVSGSILVFKEELMPKTRVHVGTVDYKACTAATLTQAMDAANAASPGMKAFLASCPTPANSLYTVTVRALPQRSAGGVQGEGSRGSKLMQRAVYLDPHTLAVVGDADREASWVETVEQFHVNLLLGRGGRLWNGIGASVLLVITLSGLVLWWPGIKNWTRGLKLDFRKSWKRINFDLHSAMGMWTVFFTLTWALTGMYFTWPKIFTTPMQKISHFETAQYPAAQIKAAQAKLRIGGMGEARRPQNEDRMDVAPPSVPAPTVAAGVGTGGPRSRSLQSQTQALVDVAGMITTAQRESPDGHLEGIFYGSGPKAMFTIYMARGILGDYSSTDFVYLDQRSGKLLYTWHRGQNHTIADWYVWLIAPLHFGTSFGQSFKVFWALMGLGLPGLTVTGLLMYWNRWLSKRWRSVIKLDTSN